MNLIEQDCRFKHLECGSIFGMFKRIFVHGT